MQALPITETPQPQHALVPLAPLESGPLALVEALLKAPASILRESRDGYRMLVRLAVVVAGTVSLVGLVMALFSGGIQLLYVPLKLTLGVFCCALLCLPSLHVFSCLSGAEQRVKDTFAALLMGVGLMGVLLVGFAPIAWIFSQATSSAAVMGAVHLLFLVISSILGLGLVNRALSAMNRNPVRTRLWSPLFVLVVLQMTTTLRPLVGPADGAFIHSRSFFLAHWAETMAGPASSDATRDLGRESSRE
jgi:hypothetical protein